MVPSTSLFSALVLGLASTVYGQLDLTANVTSLEGTWASGSAKVLTGPTFANPVNFSFNVPDAAGMAFSFTGDGYYEEASYRFEANGTHPNCVKATLIWQHGNYTLQENGSITTEPIEADGRIQIQDNCAAQSSLMEYYYQPGIYNTWEITNDVNHNAYMLQLTRYDDALYPRLFLVRRPAEMWSTTELSSNSSVADANRLRNS